VNENPGPQKVLLFPNPVDKILQFPSDFPQNIDFIDVIDMNGKTVMHILSMPGRAIDVSSLIPGFYLVYSTAGTESFLGRFIRN
jgi:hypothetical protein